MNKFHYFLIECINSIYDQIPLSEVEIIVVDKCLVQWNENVGKELS